MEKKIMAPEQHAEEQPREEPEFPKPESDFRKVDEHARNAQPVPHLDELLSPQVLPFL